MAWWFPFAFALAAFGEPVLPPALQADPQAVTAWSVARSSADSAVRREAAALILERLAFVTPAERMEFLLDCQGCGALLADLAPTFALTASQWPEARAQIAAALLTPDHRDAIRTRGVLTAAGWLALDDPASVSAVATALADETLRAAASEALRRITGREFVEPRAFTAWWASARLQSRADWLVSALEEERVRALRLWAEMIAHDPAWGLVASRDPSPAVRRLGYEALARIEPPVGLPPDSAPAQALRAAFASESDPELRVALIGWVTRFLQGEAALEILERELASARPLERLRALEQIGNVRATAACWETLTRELWRVYPLAGAPRESLEHRDALWVALNLTVAAAPDFLPTPDPQLSGFLIAVLDGLESEPAIRAREYALFARFPQEIFRNKLLAHALDSTRLAQDRAAALESLTGMFQRAGELEPLRQALPLLLDDAAPTVRGRAIRSLARLGELRDLERLAARLALESEPALQLELLKSLREKRSPVILEALLVFQPAADLRNDHVRTLQAQVVGDLAALEQVVEVLSARSQADGAYALAYGFAREGLSAEAQARHDRMLARTQTEWLLQAGVGGGDAARAADALGFLADLERRWPAEAEWPRLRVELALLMGRVDEALTAAERWITLKEILPPAQRWNLGLRVTRAAATGGFYDRGWKLLLELGAAPPEFEAQAAEVRLLFPQPVVPPAPEPEGEPEGGRREL